MEHIHESEDLHRVLHTSSVTSSLFTVGSFWLDSLTVAVCKRGQRERKGEGEMMEEETGKGRRWKLIWTWNIRMHTCTHTHTYTHMHMPTTHACTHGSSITDTHTRSTHACTHTCTHTHTLVVFPAGGPAPVSSCSAPLSTEDLLMEPQYSPQSCSHTGRQWPEVVGETPHMILETQKLTTQHILPTAQKCMPPVTFSDGSHVLYLTKTFVVETLYYCSTLHVLREMLDITTDTCYRTCSSPIMLLRSLIKILLQL